MTISATEFKTNLGKYIDYISVSDETITVTKNGKKVMQVCKPKLSGAERLASLGKLKGKVRDYDELKKAAMEDKYEITL